MDLLCRCMILGLILAQTVLGQPPLRGSNKLRRPKVVSNSYCYMFLSDSMPASVNVKNGFLETGELTNCPSMLDEDSSLPSKWVFLPGTDTDLMGDIGSVDGAASWFGSSSNFNYFDVNAIKNDSYALISGSLSKDDAVQAQLPLAVSDYPDVTHLSGNVSCQRCYEGYTNCMLVVGVDELSGMSIPFMGGCWKGTNSCSTADCVSTVTAKNHGHFNDSRFCCCSGHFCNSNLTYKPELKIETMVPSSLDIYVFPLLEMVSGLTVFFLLAIAIMIILQRKMPQFSKNIFGKLKWGAGAQANDNTGEGKEQLLLPSNSESSNWLMGLPYCDFNLCDLELLQKIHSGSFGIVWRAMHKPSGASLAAKIYTPEHIQSFNAEYEAYKLIDRFHHPNILPFLGALESVSETMKERWILTAWMPEGSLQNYLKTHELGWVDLVRLSGGIADGLAFLHADECDGIRKKPIAHRDLNSRNVLVSPACRGVIGDFGFALPLVSGCAVLHDNLATRAGSLEQLSSSLFRSVDELGCCDDSGLVTATAMQPQEPNFAPRVGTVRTMSPEVLDGAVNLSDPENSLKQADVYGLGLILWEIATRCVEIALAGGRARVPDYALPYQVEVGNAPTLEHMRVHVCNRRSRPLLPKALKTSTQQPLRSLRSIIEDCWDHESEARISAMCALQRLLNLANSPMPIVRCINQSLPTMEQSAYHKPNFNVQSPGIDASPVDPTTNSAIYDFNSNNNGKDAVCRISGPGLRVGSLSSSSSPFVSGSPLYAGPHSPALPVASSGRDELKFSCGSPMSAACDSGIGAIAMLSSGSGGGVSGLMVGSSSVASSIGGTPAMMRLPPGAATPVGNMDGRMMSVAVATGSGNDGDRANGIGGGLRVLNRCGDGSTSVYTNSSSGLGSSLSGGSGSLSDRSKLFGTSSSWEMGGGIGLYGLPAANASLAAPHARLGLTGSIIAPNHQQLSVVARDLAQINQCGPDLQPFQGLNPCQERNVLSSAFGNESSGDSAICERIVHSDCAKVDPVDLVARVGYALDEGFAEESGPLKLKKRMNLPSSDLTSDGSTIAAEMHSIPPTITLADATFSSGPFVQMRHRSGPTPLTPSQRATNSFILPNCSGTSSASSALRNLSARASSGYHGDGRPASGVRGTATSGLTSNQPNDPSPYWLGNNEMTQFGTSAEHSNIANSNTHASAGYKIARRVERAARNSLIGLVFQRNSRAGSFFGGSGGSGSTAGNSPVSTTETLPGSTTQSPATSPLDGMDVSAVRDFVITHSNDPGLVT